MFIFLTDVLKASLYDSTCTYDIIHSMIRVHTYRDVCVCVWAWGGHQIIFVFFIITTIVISYSMYMNYILEESLNRVFIINCL